ncbi:MAG: HAD-IC family P-type ATPase, partial [Firmicutes bacterium]|nr:HAD-IC family P-type ATPase [Bacillota bacterium]
MRKGLGAMCLETELISTEDFHFLPGRIRVAVPVIKNNPEKAGLLANELEKIAGVGGYANPLTGRVLLLYDPRLLEAGSLLDTLAQGVAAVNRGQVDRRPLLTAASDLQAGPPWHILEPGKVLELTNTPPEQGLSEQAARQRLELFGPNQLEGEVKKSLLGMFSESFRGFMPKLLLGAAAVSWFVGEKIDAFVITGIVMLQTALEAIQGFRAEKSLEALKELSAPRAKVIREGKTVCIPAEGLVPGDLIQLEAGDLVPADARILESSHLLTDESCLTGESIPVVKDLAVQKDPRLFTADRLNMLFAGTSVTKGKVLAVVIATGMGTEMGRIATLLSAEGQEKTPLHRQMELLGQRTTRLVLLSVGGIISVGLLRRQPLGRLLSTGVSLAVGAIPEGLPAVVTVALAFGVQRMAQRNAIVRRLSAVETLGGVTTICSDKTGTLTANEMTVKKIYADGKVYTVSGEGYNPLGNFYEQKRLIDPRKHPALQQILFGAAVCNNAQLGQKKSGHWEVMGDPTEGALLALAAKARIWPGSSREFTKLRENSFDPARRMMSVVGTDPQGRVSIYAKGAAESLLQRCTSHFAGGRIVPLDSFGRRNILEAGRAMGGEALRVLCLAAKFCGQEAETSEDNLVFLGLVGMTDPPRRGVKTALRQCRQAGIRVIMITGDHQDTAEAIARQLGLLEQGRVLTGHELEEIPSSDLAKKIKEISV